MKKPHSNLFYTPFKKISTIQEGTTIPNLPTNEIDYVYGPDHQRKQSVYSSNSVAQQTVIYSGAYEQITTTSPANTYQVNYISSPDGLVAMNVNNQLYYIHTDHLGSILNIYGPSVNYNQSFDAWGNYRDPGTWTYVPSTSVASTYSPPAWLIRGYTGHELLPQFGLINMNGRAYDPLYGQMLSPDPILQFPGFSQGFERYTYCLNNPLKFTDPSGYDEEDDKKKDEYPAYEHDPGPTSGAPPPPGQGWQKFKDAWNSAPDPEMVDAFFKGTYEASNDFQHDKEILNLGSEAGGVGSEGGGRFPNLSHVFKYINSLPSNHSNPEANPNWEQEGSTGFNQRATSVSQTGINYIKSWEQPISGSNSYHQYDYLAWEENDITGHPTIGYGHYDQNGDYSDYVFGSGNMLSQEQADALLQQDILGYENTINKLDISLNQNQFDALVCYLFNTPSLSAKQGGQPNLLSALKAGNWQKASSEMNAWNSGGQAQNGLINRDKELQNWFLNGTVPGLHVVR